MVNEYSVVFRRRQVAHDLATVLARATPATPPRVAGRAAPREREAAEAGLSALLDLPASARRLDPRAGAYGALRMAAALPDDDFEGFLFATACLLLDRLNGSETPDDLYWNWDAFADHFRLAEPWRRAAIMNGFRLGDALGLVSLMTPPSRADCLTVRKAQVLQSLSGTDDLAERVLAAVEMEVDPVTAGRLWAEAAASGATIALLPAFRYLAERPEGLAPPKPEAAPLLPALI